MAYGRRYARSNTTSTTARLLGVEREFKIYPESRYNNTCKITGMQIRRGSPIAQYIGEDGKKKYVVWPIPPEFAETPEDPFKDFNPDEYKLLIRDEIKKWWF